MESLQLIKNRIQSIGSTRQITQSMRLVSTSKVRKSRARMEENRPFLEQAHGLIGAVAGELAAVRHPYFTENTDENSVSAIVVISSDRGLCGGYNVNACRKAAKLIQSVGEKKARVVTVGAKARDYLRRRYRGAVAESFTGISENPFYDDAWDLAQLLLGWYDSGEVDRVSVVYTQFENMLSQSPAVETLLPFSPPLRKAEGETRALVRCEPAEEAMIADLAPFYLAARLYGAILESSVCEQSARITSMDTAVKSADEMIDSLTLLYNRARQGAITQEIVEVVGGANALQK